MTATTTLTWAQTAALNRNTPICFGCGTELDPVFARCGSLRCNSCRATRAPLHLGLATPIAQEDA
jgi:hypothetical protein